MTFLVIVTKHRLKGGGTHFEVYSLSRKEEIGIVSKGRQEHAADSSPPVSTEGETADEIGDLLL